MRRACLLVLFFLCLYITSSVAQQKPSWQAVDDAMGRQGQDQPDGAHRFAMPRSDLKVTANGVEIKAGFALGSWAAFQTMGNHSDVMGDLVLTDSEVGPVMQKLVESGIEITALHNHLLNETPHIMYMHVHGQGDARKTRIIPARLSPYRRLHLPPLRRQGRRQTWVLTQNNWMRSLAYRKNNNGIYQYSIPRAEKITDGGMTVPNSLGITTGINFQPTGAGKAAITGDFVMIAKEVNLVIKALRQNGIAVTALHSHMLDEQPRLYFMHFWANDDAMKLAKGLRAALDQTNRAK